VDTFPLQNVGVHVVKVWSAFVRTPLSPSLRSVGVARKNQAKSLWRVLVPRQDEFQSRKERKISHQYLQVIEDEKRR
jgi:hypothetical protein